MKYFRLTLRHKWFVLIAGLRIGGIPILRLLIHDWTKFLPCELPHYQRQFFGDGEDPEGFIRAWTHHQNSNPHHWEYWIPRTGHNRCNPPYPDNQPITMPIWAIREMVADWMAAGRAYEGVWPDKKNWVWLKEHLPEIRKRIRHNTCYHLFNVLRQMGVVWYEKETP